MDQSQEDRGILPVDPTQPDLSALARSSCAFNIPWPNNPAPLATLGSGFRTSELNTQDVQAPFQTQTAFSPRCLSESLRFREESGSKSTFHKAITSDAQSSAEHLSVSFSGGVGGKVLGASVSGKYNKDVTKNRDVSVLFLYFSDYPRDITHLMNKPRRSKHPFRPPSEPGLSSLASRTSHWMLSLTPVNNAQMHRHIFLICTATTTWGT